MTVVILIVKKLMIGEIKFMKCVRIFGKNILI